MSQQGDDISNSVSVSGEEENVIPVAVSNVALRQNGSPNQLRENMENQVEEDVVVQDVEDEIVEVEDPAPAAEQDEILEEEENDEVEIFEEDEDSESDSGRELSSDEEDVARELEQQVRVHLRPRNRHFRISQDGEMEAANENEANENIDRPQNITFDRSLPTSHTYLGEMNDCSGIPYIEQETFVVLPILKVHAFILVPGQSMPLNINHPREMSLMRAVMAREDKTFGVLLLKNNYDSNAPKKVEFGCTAELRSMRLEEVDEISMMVGIAIGRQRFKVMEERRELDGNVTAKVRILRDDDLPPPAFSARLGIHHKLHLLPVNDQKGRRCLQHRSQAKAAWLTRLPPWVHDMYDVRKLREQLIVELKEWNHDLKEKSLPISPTEFSYWVASHLLMTDSIRLHLLAMDNSVQRLRCELNLIRTCTIYECKYCGEEIARKRDVFSMSHGGPMAAYVNPSGHIHETLTVYRTKNIAHKTRPSTEHSWFPGYAWSICECSCCSRHMGWKFTATKSDLSPAKFWGITRSSLSLRMGPEQINEEEEASLPSTTRRPRLNSQSSDTSSVVSTRNTEWTPML